jgi:hypothetical protein
MIDFPCQCGHRFSVPEDTAGASLQCPKCHRLVDVPTLGDLAGILPDGTYSMDAPTPRDPQMLANMLRAFNRDTHDEYGREKDLRLSEEDLLNLGAPPAAAEPSATGAGAPKYDPESGELLRPMKIAPTPAIVVAPHGPPKPVIAYASAGTSNRVGPMQVFIELFAPANAMVMSFIFAFHLLLQGLVIIVSVLFPVVGIICLIVAILAHYGCIVEDVGTEDRDELPRPLRNLAFVEDLWKPFCFVVGAFLLSYLPAIIASIKLPMETRGDLFILGALSMLGSTLFPAVFLTLQTSGAIANLRPDRVLGTIRAAGAGRYALIVVLWIIAFNVYTAGVYSFDVATTIGLLVWKGKTSRVYWAISILLLMLGVYLMHAFAWQLGLMYRQKHAYFPWVLQHHVRLNKREQLMMDRATRAAILAKRRAAAAARRGQSPTTINPPPH